MRISLQVFMIVSVLTSCAPETGQDIRLPSRSDMIDQRIPSPDFSPQIFYYLAPTPDGFMYLPGTAVPRDHDLNHAPYPYYNPDDDNQIPLEILLDSQG